MRTSLSLASLLLALASCGGTQHNQTTEPIASASPSPAPTAEPSTAPSTVASASPAPASAAPIDLPPMPTTLHGPAHPWAHMNARERAQYMGESIVPAMQAMMSAYDPHAFEHVTCATCHGANAHDVHFHMPNTLPRLPAFGSEAQHRMHEEHPRMVAFMAQRMVPAMAQLLGQQPFDMQTHQGFGCYNCHPHD